jgi:hypothetical protein
MLPGIKKIVVCKNNSLDLILAGKSENPHPTLML